VITALPPSSVIYLNVKCPAKLELKKSPTSAASGIFTKRPRTGGCPRKQPRQIATVTLHLPGGRCIEYSPHQPSIRNHCVIVQWSGQFCIYVPSAMVTRIVGAAVLTICQAEPAPLSSGSSPTDKSTSLASSPTDKSTWVHNNVNLGNVNPDKNPL